MFATRTLQTTQRSAFNTLLRTQQISAVSSRHFSSSDHAKQVVKDKLLARNFEESDAEQVAEIAKKYHYTS